MTAYPSDRTGRGRWCTIQRPAPGVLWEADNGSVGFQPVPMPGIDPTPVTDLLATCALADHTPTVAFDQIAALAGAFDVKVGSLDGFQPDSQRPSRTRAPSPAPDVLAALEGMTGGTT